MTNEERDMFMSMLSVALEGAKYQGILYERAEQLHAKAWGNRAYELQQLRRKSEKDQKEIQDLKTKLIDLNPVVFTGRFGVGCCFSQVSACGNYKAARSAVNPQDWAVNYIGAGGPVYLGTAGDSSYIKVLCNHHSQTCLKEKTT